MWRKFFLGHKGSIFIFELLKLHQLLKLHSLTTRWLKSQLGGCRLFKAVCVTLRADKWFPLVLSRHGEQASKALCQASLNNKSQKTCFTPKSRSQYTLDLGATSSSSPHIGRPWPSQLFLESEEESCWHKVKVICEWVIQFGKSNNGGI